MSAEKIKTQYDELFEIAKTFDANSGNITQQLQRIRQGADLLKNGDWEGSGADLFYEEMSSNVIPAFQRLSGSMAQAAQLSRQIISKMQDAEENAARLLLMNGANSLNFKQQTTYVRNASTPLDSTLSMDMSMKDYSGNINDAGVTNVSAFVKTNLQPPSNQKSRRVMIEQAMTAAGLLGSVVSILEAGSATIFAEGVVGTSIGAVLLPFGAFWFGAQIAEERENYKNNLDIFGSKLLGSAILDAIPESIKNAQLQGVTIQDHPLNEKGMQATKTLYKNWKIRVDNEISDQLQMINGAKTAEQWEPIYEQWKRSITDDLTKIYLDPSMRK